MNTKGEPSAKHERKDDDGKLDPVNAGIDQGTNKEEAKEDANKEEHADEEQANEENIDEEHVNKEEAPPDPYTMLIS